MKRALAIACCLAAVGIGGVGDSPSADDSSPVVKRASAEFVEIDTRVPGWQRVVLDQLAMSDNRLMLYCNVFDYSRVVLGHNGGPLLRVPAGVAGMAEIARSAGYIVRDLGDRTLVVQMADALMCDGAVIVLAQRVNDFGDTASGVDRTALEWRLLQTSGSRNILAGVDHGPVVLSTYYWPSVEGRGVEFYALQRTSATSVRGGSHGALRKVSARADGPVVHVEDLWLNGDGQQPGVEVDGPIADIQEDFDGDGVIDIVSFSGLGQGAAAGPLVIISGATGRRIGLLQGYEFVFRRNPGGGVAAVSIDDTAVRSYALDSKGQLGLLKQVQLGKGQVRPLSRESFAAVEESSNGVASDEAPVVLPIAPAGVALERFASIRRVKAIGQDRQQLKPLSQADVHVYLSYPGKANREVSSVPREESKKNP